MDFWITAGIIILIVTVPIGGYYAIQWLNKQIGDIQEKEKLYKIKRLDIKNNDHYTGIRSLGRQTWPEMNDQLWDDSSKFDRYLKLYINDSTSNVALSTVDGSVIGFILTTFHKDNFDNPNEWKKLSSSKEIIGEWITVSHEFRKNGIGKALIKKSRNESRQYSQIQYASLQVRKSNIEAVNLFKHFGFGTEQTVKNKYGNGEDGLIMVKDL